MADINVIALPSMVIEGMKYHVVRYDLDEALDRVSQLVCVLSAGDEMLPRPEAVIDKPASFSLDRSDGTQSRAFVGTIVEAEVAPGGDGVTVLHISVVPALWNLEQRADCRIFQEMSVVDIVTQVLEDAGVPGGQQDWRVTEDHPVRTYVVQYRETDFAFVKRLLAEEGIYFAVHIKDGKDIVVFGDAPSGLGDIEGETTIPFLAEIGIAGSSDLLYRLSRATSVQSDKVYVRDYNAEKPSLQIEGEAEGEDPGDHMLEVYDYPARTDDLGVAKQRAKVMVEAMQAKRDVIHGETGSLALVPGLRFTAADHPYEPLNQELMITRSRISGQQAREFEGGGGGPRRGNSHKVEFWSVPTKTTKYRPKRRIREAFIPGTQTAITTGPPGEEIHTDASAQVKVSFHWDRSGNKDDTSSRWMRTSQVPTGGSMLLPRVGWEVNVSHLEGDADRPMVMGRVYNTLTPPPYALPEGAGKSSLQTATTPGGGSSNEMRMSDSAGGEEIFFNGSKDMTTDVKNNVTESIGNDHKKKVGSTQKKNVTNSMTESVGSNQSIKVSGDQSLKVETYKVDEVGADHKLTIGGNRDLKIGGDHKRDVGGASTLEISGNQADLVVGSVTEETLAAHKHEVGAALVELAVGDRVVTVAGDRKEDAGAVKVIAVKGGRGVTVGGTMDQKVAGAIVNVATGDRAESSGGTFTSVAAGAQLVKAENVVFEAEGMLTLVMGASILSLTPASVTFIGTSLKLDGDVTDTAALVVDN